MKHAFLIIAHDKFEQLQMLIDLLDDSRNDIFVHIDKKVKKLPELHASFSRLYVLDERVDVRWMDVSLVRCELLLFRTAYQKGLYDYYHLLSGADLPIKSNDYIHSFITMNAGKEFVGFVDEDSTNFDRVNKFHMLTKYYLSGNFSGFVIRIVRKLTELVINLVFCRKNDEMVCRKGSEWVSVSDNFVGYLLSREDYILKRYSHTRGSDEYFIQTIMWNSAFRNMIYCPDDEFKSSLREIDWKRGCPYTWGKSEEDLEILEHSKALFARKFDSRQYPGIVNSIISLLHN